MHLFYTPDIEGGLYQLSQEESQHAARVLRLYVGSEVVLTDGKGNWMPSKIVEIHPKSCLVQVSEIIENYEPKPYHLQIAIAPTKNIDRFEWFLEKSTEIGIDRIIAISTEHSERKDIKTDRLNKIITSAMKQSLKAWHPELEGTTKFDSFIQQPFDGIKLIAWCEAAKEERIEKYVRAQENVLILIGPEGGFSPAEVQKAREQGFVPVSLSSSRLRTETAAIVACHSVAFINKF